MHLHSHILTPRLLFTAFCQTIWYIRGIQEISNFINTFWSSRSKFTFVSGNIRNWILWRCCSALFDKLKLEVIQWCSFSKISSYFIVNEFIAASEETNLWKVLLSKLSLAMFRLSFIFWRYSYYLSEDWSVFITIFAIAQWAFHVALWRSTFRLTIVWVYLIWRQRAPVSLLSHPLETIRWVRWVRCREAGEEQTDEGTNLGSTVGLSSIGQARDPRIRERIEACRLGMVKLETLRNKHIKLMEVGREFIMIYHRSFIMIFICQQFIPKWRMRFIMLTSCVCHRIYFMQNVGRGKKLMTGTTNHDDQRC